MKLVIARGEGADQAGHEAVDWSIYIAGLCQQVADFGAKFRPIAGAAGLDQGGNKKLMLRGPAFGEVPAHY